MFIALFTKPPGPYRLKTVILTSVGHELQQQIFSHGNISSPAVSIGIANKLRKHKNHTALIYVVLQNLGISLTIT